MARKVVLLDSASTDLTELGIFIASQSGVQVANAYLDRGLHGFGDISGAWPPSRRYSAGLSNDRI